MPGSFFVRLHSSRQLRLAMDLLWIGAFGVIVLVLLLGSSEALYPDSGVRLELNQGIQQQGIYRAGKRLGTVRWRVQRNDRGWRVENLLSIRDVRAARVQLNLRSDLSLEYLELDADFSHLGQISTVSPLLLGQIKQIGQLRLKGQCVAETGECRLLGTLGKFPIDQSITAGRGPVVTSAIYPLLARGTLGQQAELTIFDPLSLRQRVVSFRIEGAEALRLRSGRYDALRVTRDLEGLVTRVWINKEGRVLKEEMPMGIIVEHETFTETEEHGPDR